MWTNRLTLFNMNSLILKSKVELAKTPDLDWCEIGENSVSLHQT